jgi:hypothetical protein
MSTIDSLVFARLEPQARDQRSQIRIAPTNFPHRRFEQTVFGFNRPKPTTDGRG